ncbi:hypothetical protein [Macrococcoides bohemicum]|uniref:hypothetical protein n=1 Tax=Macrococcoides bohemicum TaxID=1903056 RepID=UPI00289B732D|nr:hypothetical protein [Macrococcus bohemicus]
MKEEIQFYFKHFFDFDTGVTKARYKKQNTICFIIILILAIPAYFLFIKFYDELSFNELIKMEDKAYEQYKMNQGIFYVVFAGLFFLLIHIIQLSNEIHRYNARDKNWIKPILYLLILYLIYIVVNLILFLNRQPELMRSTFGILILSQFLWIGNDEFLEGET